MRRCRSGVALLALAFLVAALLGVWGMQQSWQSGEARRRIREAELDAALTLQTDSCLDMAETFLRLVGNDGAEDPADLGRALRELAIGDEVEVAFDPPYLLNRLPGITVAVESSKARAVLLMDFPIVDQRYDEARDGPGPDCSTYAQELEAFADLPVLPPGLAGLLPGAAARPRRSGVIELEVVSRADGLGLVRRVIGRKRLAFELVVPPCPEVLGEVLGVRFGSLIELNPVELARSFESVDAPEDKR